MVCPCQAATCTPRSATNCWCCRLTPCSGRRGIVPSTTKLPAVSRTRLVRRIITQLHRFTARHTRSFTDLCVCRRCSVRVDGEGGVRSCSQAHEFHSPRTHSTAWYFPPSWNACNKSPFGPLLELARRLTMRFTRDCDSRALERRQGVLPLVPREVPQLHQNLQGPHQGYPSPFIYTTRT
jgi:hypothetical protein